MPKNGKSKKKKQEQRQLQKLRRQYKLDLKVVNIGLLKNHVCENCRYNNIHYKVSCNHKFVPPKWKSKGTCKHWEEEHNSINSGTTWSSQYTSYNWPEDPKPWKKPKWTQPHT